MLLHPAVLALLVTSVVVCVLAAAAAAAGIASVAGWDPEDGGERQLARERRMLLVEATVTVVCVTQLIALVAFVATIDRLLALGSPGWVPWLTLLVLAGWLGTTTLSPGVWTNQASSDWECWAAARIPAPSGHQMTIGILTCPPSM